VNPPSSRHTCPVCGMSETRTSICADCASTLTERSVSLPSPDATEADVRQWAEHEGVSLGARF
jgi:exosome complex RNA-binding protein Csl4